MRMQIEEQFLVLNDFAPPLTAIEGLQFVELLAREVETGPLDLVVIRHPADGCFLRGGAAVRAIDNPLQHAHILAEARPDELAVRVFAEPVDVEDARRFAELPLDLDPVTEI